jgi:GntR family transcriptional repressor for pyruvate dehydrogenase complex
MQFEPITQKRTSEAVIENLEARILDGSFEDGVKLPSEEQLATQLGVGRRAVREALKILEAKGLVDIQMGVGAIVQRNDLDNFLETLTHNVRSYLSVNRADLEHVMELRKLLEGAAMERFLKAPNPQTLQELAKAVAYQRSAFAEKDYAAYQRWHFEFHTKIVGVLENPVISMIYQQTLMLIRSPMERTGSHPEVMARAIEDHAQMIDALQRGAQADLNAVLEAHLTNFIIDLTTYGA